MIYNYLSDDVTQDVVVDDIYDVIEDIYDEYDRLHRNECIQLYVPGWIEKEIISLLLDLEEFFVSSDSELTSSFDDDEWCLVSIFNNGEIFVDNIRSYFGDCKFYSTVETLNYVYDEMKKSDLSELEKYGDSILVFGFNQDDFDCKRHCRDCYDYECPYNDSESSVEINREEIVDEDECEKYIRSIIRKIALMDSLFGF